jgi:hypothetical protein
MMKLARPLSLLVLLATQAHAGAPEALKGKSIVLTWSETRQQRHVGEPHFYSVNARVNLSLYVSTAGRVFVRRTNTTGSGSGSFEGLPAESGGRSNASFVGQTLMLIGTTAGGAHRTLVERVQPAGF